jgi:hypothetical protein
VSVCSRFFVLRRTLLFNNSNRNTPPGVKDKNVQSRNVEYFKLVTNSRRGRACIANLVTSPALGISHPKVNVSLHVGLPVIELTEIFGGIKLSEFKSEVQLYD